MSAPVPPTPLPAPADAAAPTPAPPLPAPAEAPTPVPDVSDDSLYSALKEKGRVALPLTFLPGQPDINVESAPVIVSVVALLQKHPDLQLEIEGYTDNTGDPQSNQRLSAQRAETVRDLLVAGHIQESRLAALGLGGSQPVADNGTPEGRAKNRRIELALRTDPPPAPVVAPAIVPQPLAQQPPAKPVPSQQPTPDDSAANDSPAFHSAAPNGVNYYPTNGQ